MVRKGRAFYATLYQVVFFAKQGGGGSLTSNISMLPVEAQRNSDVSWVAIAKKVFLDTFFQPADVGGISILFAHKTGSIVLYI